MDNTYEFVRKLSSKDPIPGGGGASAMLGAISAALCSMVANLTIGKKKYAQYESELIKVLEDVQDKINTFIELIDEDAKAFLPLWEAYSIPKDDENRDIIMEKALYDACIVPFNILCVVDELTDSLIKLQQMGSKLALSDVAVAATTCRAAAEGTAMNVFVNTRLMKDREYAAKINSDTKKMVINCQQKCVAVYEGVMADLW